MSLGVNKSEKAIIWNTWRDFEDICKVPAISGAHSERSTVRDLKEILKKFQQIYPFQCTEGKKYKPFTNLKI